MSKDKGYILIYRDIQDHVLWLNEKFTKGQAWVDLLLLANHENKSFLLGDEVINAEKGSVITSEKKLMERWKWSKDKVRRFLKLLEKLEMIERKTDKKKTVIYLINYEEYQTSYKSKVNQDVFQNQTRDQTRDNTTNQTTEKHLILSDSKEEQTRDNTTDNTRNDTTNRPVTDHKQTSDDTQTKHYKSTTNTLQKKEKDSVIRCKYGEYKNVLLSDEELEALKKEYPSMWKDKLEGLSSYMASTGKKYKSHYATIRNWIKNDFKKGRNDDGEEDKSRDKGKTFNLKDYI